MRTEFQSDRAVAEGCWLAGAMAGGGLLDAGRGCTVLDKENAPGTTGAMSNVFISLHLKMKPPFIIDSFGARILCDRKDTYSQDITKNVALQQHCKGFKWGEEGIKYLGAYVEFKLRTDAERYVSTINKELNRDWDLEKQLYARMGGHLANLYSEPEVRMKFALQAALGGKTEVKTLLGRIDLLTETELIEVKPFKDWKSAIGQVLVYGSFYLQHKKRIHLFDRQDQPKLNLIQNACNEYGIEVTFQIDRGWE